MDLDELRTRLNSAVARGDLGAGVAHRAVLAARLAGTLSHAGGKENPIPVSGEVLGRTVGLSRAAVHKHVGYLRSLGFSVRSYPGKGYGLDRPFTDLVAAEAVLPFLLVTADAPWTAGLPYLYVPRCGSTNLALKEATESRRVESGRERNSRVAEIQARAPRHGRERATIGLPGSGGLPAGAVVVTDEQTRGRGRLGRLWSSEPGRDLTFSVLLRPALGPAQAHLISLAAALAVAEVLETLPGLGGQVAVKWPNDVLLGEEKVCGILIEGSIDADSLHWAVAGLGLNVNSTPSGWMAGLTAKEANNWAGRPRPVSLFERLGRQVPRAPLLAALLERLTGRFTELEEGANRPTGGGAGDGASSGLDNLAGAAKVVAELRRRDALAGRQVEVLAGPHQGRVVVSGEAVGIGPEGQLLVRRASGETVAVFAGDVSLRTVNQADTNG